VAKKAAKAAVKKTAASAKAGAGAAPKTVSFGPVKNELAYLRTKLDEILTKEGENLTIRDIILKIDALDRLLICQTVMTRSF
jgi:hypothetical protein